MRQATGSTLRAAFKFPVQGEGWQNRFLVGAGLTLAGIFIPIVPLIFVYGYALEVMRRVIRGEAPSLPAWDDWGRLGLDGLRAGVTYLVYLLPGLIAYGGGMVLYLVGATVLPLFMGSGQDPSTAFTGFLLLMANVGVLMVSMSLAMLLFVLGAIPLPLALGHVADKGTLGAAFRLRELWRILRANGLGFFIAWVIMAGLVYMLTVGLMVVYYSMVLCCLVPFLLAPAGFYLQMVGAAVFAQSYREGVEALGQDA